MKHGDPRVLSESAFADAIRLNKKPWICEFCGVAHSMEQAHWCVSALRTGDDLKYVRRRIFSLSLGDWLDPEVPIEWLARMLDTIFKCADCTWILLTKRTQLWRERLEWVSRLAGTFGDDKFSLTSALLLRQWLDGQPPMHVWIVASAGHAKALETMSGPLLDIPASVHGLSCEPLTEDILPDLRAALIKAHFRKAKMWVILGGESHQDRSKARPCNIDWLFRGISACHDFETERVPCFVKQIGSNAICDNANLLDWPDDSILRGQGEGFASCRILTNHKKGGDMKEWPEPLRIREFPVTKP